MTSISGIILVNKPCGISSFTAVKVARKAIGAEKAGHLGTLDVAADGLLPVALGKATQLFDLFLTKDKTYVATFLFGTATDTFDLDGQVVMRNNKKIVQSDIEKVLPSLIGRYPQMPPAYSAKKINGKRAYQIAREGGEVELKPKEIEVYSIKILEQVSNNVFKFEIKCSSGTYIRSICRDLAQKLSTCAVMTSLTRTKCGQFEIQNSFTLQQIKVGDYSIISPEDLFDFSSKIYSSKQVFKLQNGASVEDNENGLFKAYSTEISSQNFLGIVEIKNNNAKLKYRF